MSERAVSLVMELMVKSGLVFGVAFIVSSLLERHSASVRHRALAAAFLAALALPVFRVAVPTFPLRLLAATSSSAQGVTAVQSLSGRPSGTKERSSLVTAGDLPGKGPSTPTSSTDWTTYATIVWALGALALFARLTVAYHRARRIGIRATTSVDGRLGGRMGAHRPWMSFTRTPEVRLSRDVATPIVVGILRPVVVLPQCAAEWGGADLDAVIAHEMAHVERRDLAVALAAQIACVVYWCNPLVWIAAARLARESERACDDRVLRSGADIAGYGRLLLRLAVAARTQGLPPSTAMAMARPSELETRLLAILDLSTRRETPSRWLTVLLVSGAVMLAGGSAAVKLEAATVPAPAPATVQPRAPESQQVPSEPDTRGDSLASPSSERIPNGPSEARIAQALESALAGPDSALAIVLRSGLARRSSSVELVRDRSAWALAQERNGELVAPLLDALASRDWRIQAYAAWALAYARSDRVDSRLAPLLDHPVWRVRAIAAAALHGTRDSRAQAGFDRALRDEAWQVRLAAVEHFASISDPRLLEQLRPLLDDRHIAVRTAAADAVGSR